MMAQKKYTTWNEACSEGFTLVVKANRLDHPGGFEEDKKLATLAGKALLVGIDPDWIQDMLSVGCDENIQTLIKRKTH